MAKDTYKAATINVDTGGTVITPAFDIHYWAVYSDAGDFTVELYAAGYGDTIKGYKGIGLSDNFDATRIRIKSIAGTITVSYYLRGL